MIARGCLEKWTYEAMLCYRIGCRCSVCPNRFLESSCLMKYTVRLLVQKFGAPKNICRYNLAEGIGDDTEYTINTWILREEGQMLQ